MLQKLETLQRLILQLIQSLLPFIRTYIHSSLDFQGLSVGALQSGWIGMEYDEIRGV